MITDEQSAEEWFSNTTDEICLALSLRTALRAFAALGYAEDKDLGDYCLVTFRALLVSFAAVGVPRSKNLEKAAISSASGVLEANPFSIAAKCTVEQIMVRNRPGSIAHLAASAASASEYIQNRGSTASVSRDSMYQALDFDSQTVSERHLDYPQELLFSQLWDELESGKYEWGQPPEPEGLKEGRKRLLSFFDAAPTTWRFWKDWYLKMYHEGEPDWDLCREVALIPDDIWDQGPEAVAREIERIERSRDPLDDDAAKAQAEKLQQDPQATSLCAEGLARFLEGVVKATKQDFNGIPRPFESMAPLTGQLYDLAGAVLKAPNPQSEAEVAKLLKSTSICVVSLLERLREAQADVAELKRQLAEAKDDITLQNALLRAAEQNPNTEWVKSIAIGAIGGTIANVAPNVIPHLFDPATWSFLTTGLTELLGPDMSDPVAQLGECYREFVRPENIPDLQLPTEIEIERFKSDDWA